MAITSSILSVCSPLLHLDPVPSWFPPPDSFPFTILLSPFRFNPYVWLFIKGSGLKTCHGPSPLGPTQDSLGSLPALPKPPPSSVGSRKHPLHFSLVVLTLQKTHLTGLGRHL